jgi:hypothetical protein
MGVADWLWGDKSSSTDPIKDLDPSLREFLEKETPKPQTQTQKPKEKPSWLSRVEPQAPQQQAPPPPAQALPHPDTPTVPKESLFQDGRYAHLWKSYRPLSEQEEAGKDTTEKMRDIHELHTVRKTSAAHAARENCVEYEKAYYDCLGTTTWNSKLFMCTPENRALSRCIDMQVKFLKALGYMGIVGDPNQEERIQMHADKLYQRMLEQEKAREEARKEGREPPPFEPILTPSTVSAAMASPVGQASVSQTPDGAPLVDPFDPSDLPQHRQKQFLAETKGKSPEEALLWKESVKGEFKHKTQYAVQYKEALAIEKEQRAERFQKGIPTIGDRLKRWGGWDSTEVLVKGVDDTPPELPEKREG